MEIDVNEISTIKMVTKNEKNFKTAIIGDNVCDWVGIGWIIIRKAKKGDYGKYDHVVIDNKKQKTKNKRNKL